MELATIHHVDVYSIYMPALFRLYMQYILSWIGENNNLVNHLDFLLYFRMEENPIVLIILDAFYNPLIFWLPFP
jgi:hypothetical protein